jgi:hypothetical protein
MSMRKRLFLPVQGDSVDNNFLFREGSMDAQRGCNTVTFADFGTKKEANHSG